jgi:uncharacterized protein YukE
MRRIDMAFIKADIGAVSNFEADSATAKTEFSDIKTDFADINSTLLSKWIGKGANAYKDETDDILERCGEISGTLEAIIEATAKIKQQYLDTDEALKAENLKAGEKKEE